MKIQAVILLILIALSACSKDKEQEPQSNIVPHTVRAEDVVQAKAEAQLIASQSWELTSVFWPSVPDPDLPGQIDVLIFPEDPAKSKDSKELKTGRLYSHSSYDLYLRLNDVQNDVRTIRFQYNEKGFFRDQYAEPDNPMFYLEPVLEKSK